MNLRTCFVIAPIGDEDSEFRAHSDSVLKHIVEPVAEKCGFSRPSRADQIGRPGQISNQIIDHLVNDDLVIADLSFHNPNVFYELAIRHALRKPIVQIIRKGDRIPFDVSPIRTIEFVLDLDGVSRCKDELTKQINASIENPDDVDTPLTSSLNIQALRASEDPVGRGNAEILSVLQQLSSRFDDLVAVMSEDDRQAEMRPRTLSRFASVDRSRPTMDNAVLFNKEVEVVDDDREEGRVLMLITRPVPIATATMRFEKDFAAKPSLLVKLESGPSPVRCFGGLGTFNDFNVHLNSRTRGERLTEGEYVVHYSATVLPSLFDHEDDTHDLPTAVTTR
jgi:hypothetical protein